MISTQNPKLFPDKKKLRGICKAIAVLDAIISQEWEYRYYSFNSKWDENEEFFEMRDGEGNHMLILFQENGVVINGFSHEFQQQEKQKLTNNLPENFEKFIFGEPVKTIGTTFCIWCTELNNWQTGDIENYEDNSQDMLAIFDGIPQKYIDWASIYFEGDYKERGMPLDVVTQIYNGETLTKEMVLSIVDEIEDWKLLKEDLIEINYPFEFDGN